MLKQFSHTMFYVFNLNRAVKFWTETFNFKLTYISGEDFASLIHERYGRITLHGGAEDNSKVGSGGYPYFYCDDIEATCNYLKEKGITVLDIKTAGPTKFTQFYDTEGNIVGIEQY